MPIVFDDVSDEHVVDARRIIAESFAGEAFAHGMYGEPLADRVAGMQALWSTWPGDAPGWRIGAFDDGRLIGVMSATVPGRCQLCDVPEEPPAVDASAGDRIEHEFEHRCRQAHRASALPPHAHIPSVAILDGRRGSGLGRRLVGHAITRMWDDGAPCVVLECIDARRAFYERCGLRPMVTFDDPAVVGLTDVLMRIDRPT